MLSLLQIHLDWVYNDAKISVLNTALFEVKYFRIFRFEDYIDSLLSCSTVGQAIGEISKMLNDFLRGSSQIDYVQITGKYKIAEEVSRLLREKGITTLFNLPKEFSELVLNSMTRCDQINSLLEQISEKRSRGKTPSPTSDIIIRYSGIIQEGAGLVERLLASIELFEDKETVRSVLLKTIAKYKELVMFLGDSELLKGNARLLERNKALLDTVVRVESSVNDCVRTATLTDEKPSKQGSCVVN